MTLKLIIKDEYSCLTRYIEGDGIIIKCQAPEPLADVDEQSLLALLDKAYGKEVYTIDDMSDWWYNDFQKNITVAYVTTIKNGKPHTTAYVLKGDYINYDGKLIKDLSIYSNVYLMNSEGKTIEKII